MKLFNWIREKLNNIFLWSDKNTVENAEQSEPEPIMVRVDLLENDDVNERIHNIREQIKSGSRMNPNIAKILEGSDENSVEEVFNSLPFTRISDSAKAEIIDIVYLDMWNESKERLRYTKGSSKKLDQLMDETNQNIDKNLENE